MFLVVYTDQKSQNFMYTYVTPHFRCQIFLPSDLQSLFCLQFWCVPVSCLLQIFALVLKYTFRIFVSMLFCIYTLREIAASLYKAYHGLLCTLQICTPVTIYNCQTVYWCEYHWLAYSKTNGYYRFLYYSLEIVKEYSIIRIHNCNWYFICFGV